MPPRKWIDKKNASTYQLFHRPQHDPLIHDPQADDRVLHHVSGPDTQSQAGSDAPKRTKNLEDLSHEFGANAVRQNEGEAANYGIYFDDSKYDYMQHLRELGTGGGNATFVEAKNLNKGKGKMKLEDALREGLSLDDKSETGSMYSDMRSSMVSSYTRPKTYQDQQDVPDAIAGFQPDMDPRLREALEALEDEEFVDDDDDAVFGQLTRDAEEVEPGEWEDSLFDVDGDEYEGEYADEDGWESDATEKAPVQMESTEHVSSEKDIPASEEGQEEGELPAHDAPAPDLHPDDQGWMHEFAKFKKDAKSGKAPAPAAAAAAPSISPSEQRSTTLASTAFTEGGTPIRRKKRKGAMTNPSAYSMTSSALARTEGHRLLDDRFDRVEALYAVDEEDEDAELEDDMSMASGMTGMTGASAMSSQAPSLVDANGTAVPPKQDFNSIMDGFLDQWDDRTSSQVKRKGNKLKRGKNGNEALGIRMLDEVRSGLGPARIPAKARAAGRV